jgi:signal transduction histidine kinase/ActR/RegA family two-component response regulator
MDGDVLVSAATQNDMPLADQNVPPVLEGAGIKESPRFNGEIRVGNLAKYGGEYLFGVHQPLLVDGQEAVLTALILPASILELLIPQGLPKDWVGVVLDSNRTIVARTLSHEGMLGQPAAASLRAALDGANEGWFHGTTIENFDVYTPFHRSSASGWTVALGIPAEHVESSMNTSLSVLALGLLCAVSVAMTGAAIYSKHIVRPIVSLATRAAALGTGDEIRPLQQSRFREVRAVSQALAASSEAIRDREHRLRAADRAKNEFLAMLGHELRNPLAAIASAAQVLSIKPLDPVAADHAAGVVTRQADRMTRLVDDLLNVGRVVSGKVELKLGPLDLSTSAAQVLEHLSRAAVFDERIVETDLSPVWISGDETRIEQILGNLLENAGKYTPPGGRIAIKVFEEDRKAVFDVTDTGVGLQPALLPRVFDLFSQGDRSMDRPVSGLGIGLTLVKQLTEMHGGEISVQSSGVNRGAQFTATFPAIAAPPGKKDGPRQIAAVAQPRHVLLVEDNDDARQAMAMMLTHYGYRVLEAADGAEAITNATTHVPECAVIDIGLPQLDGYQVAERLRATPSCADMLMIALSGYGGDEARQKAKAAGFDDYLVKPVSPSKLFELVEKHART